MAKTIDQLVQEAIGAQLFQILMLQAEVEKLQAEVEKLQEEIKKLKEPKSE